MRISTILAICVIIAYNVLQEIKIKDLLTLYSTITLVDSLTAITIGWLFYKNPPRAHVGNELVSVLIPIYNQRNMISIVIDAIAHSSYKNVEMVAVDDGSTDGTAEILDQLATKYVHLRVFHKKNEGKRKANALAFSKSQGKFIVFIDSDSVIDSHAIEEALRTFNAEGDVGAVVGHAKVWNSKKSILPRLQDGWYDFEFNVLKGTQSVLQSVLCCSGCFSAYRREAIEKFVPLWNSPDNGKYHDARKYFRTNPWKINILAKIPLKILEWASQYDDAEDITLTSQTLVDWKTKYVASSIVYTDVPETLRSFIKQQLRWRKGGLRAAFFVFTFIWRKNPVIAAMFYTSMLTVLSGPVILMIMLYYCPFVLHQYSIPVVFFSGLIGIGLSQGLDYKFRDPQSVNWKYRPLMNIVVAFLLSVLVIPALLTLKKNHWLTR